MEQLYYQEDNFQEQATCKVTSSLKQEVVMSHSEFSDSGFGFRSHLAFKF